MTRPTPKPRRKVLAEGVAWTNEAGTHWHFGHYDHEISADDRKHFKHICRAQLIEVPERKRRGTKK